MTIEEEPGTETEVEDALAELTQLLTDNPTIEQQIRETIEHHLKQGINEMTFYNLSTALDIIAGPNAASLITMVISANSSEPFDELKALIKEENGYNAVYFLKHLTALYGNELEKAGTIFTAGPNDWSHAGVTAIREEGEEGTWFIEIDLTKNDGGKIHLRMPPQSALRLAERFLREIGKVPEEMIAQEGIQVFNEETTAFRKKFLEKSSKKD